MRRFGSVKSNAFSSAHPIIAIETPIFANRVQIISPSLKETTQLLCLSSAAHVLYIIFYIQLNSINRLNPGPPNQSKSPPCPLRLEGTFVGCVMQQKIRHIWPIGIAGLPREHSLSPAVQRPSLTWCNITSLKKIKFESRLRDTFYMYVILIWSSHASLSSGAPTIFRCAWKYCSFHAYTFFRCTWNFRQFHGIPSGVPKIAVPMPAHFFWHAFNLRT